MSQPFYRGIDTEKQIQEMNAITKERLEELWGDIIFKKKSSLCNIDKALRKYDQLLRKENRINIMALLGI